MRPGASSGAKEAIHALSRLLSTVAEAGGGPATVERALVQEARRHFGCARAALLRLEGGGATELAADPEAPAANGAHALLALPLRGAGAAVEVLALADGPEREWGEEEIEVAAAFASAATASLAQLRLADELAARAAQQAALARAAKSLNESLDLPRVLGRICREAAAIVDAELAVVWRGDPTEGVTIEATHGFPPEVIGYRLEPGEGLAGRVARLGESVLVNEYAEIAPPDSPFVGVHSVLGVPMRWNGELHGVLAVGYARPHAATEADLRLLETFAELAAVACRNASAHAGLVHAARTDGLTGCLNHAALHDALEREVERCRRSGHPLSLVLLDLDDFKQVNERHGHLVGDEVLRRIGHALQQTLRPYDHVARYGGDEFAIVAVDAAEDEAAEIAIRAIERLPAALGDFAGDWPSEPGGCATAGVAEWSQPLGTTDLIAEADRALLFGKHDDGPMRVVAASMLPEGFRPGRFRRRDEGARRIPAPAWSPAGRQQLDRLRRRMRQLSLANALGVRLSALTRPAEVLDAAVDELHRIFGYELSAIVRVREDGYVEVVAARGSVAERGLRHSQPRSAGIVGRCLRERTAVVSGDVTLEPEYVETRETAGTRSEACVPIVVGDAIWGALNVETSERDAFEEDDVRLLQTVADQVGAALRSALEHERVERELEALRRAAAGSGGAAPGEGAPARAPGDAEARSSGAPGGDAPAPGAPGADAATRARRKAG